MPELILTGPAGRLEARYHHNKEDRTAPVAIILHPHPQHGGTMNNKIVYNLFQTFVQRGFSTLRFNYRGVGKSQGEWDEGEGELADAAACFDWLQSVNPNARQVWVAGFSFGALIGMQLLMRRPETHGWVMVAPPANMYDFGFLAPCPCSGIMVQGTHDDIVTEPSVQKLVQKLRAQRGIDIDYAVVDGANHFFTDHMGPMLNEVNGYLDRRLGTVEALAAAG